MRWIIVSNRLPFSKFENGELKPSSGGLVTALSGAIDRGLSALVDADMNEESTRLQALQVKQQLGVQALSIANSSSQSILSLFRG